MKKIAFLIVVGVLSIFVVSGCKKASDQTPEVSTNAPAMTNAPAGTNAPH